ncbi:acyl-CoA dehydrogenase family protein [Paenibacillus sp. PR3]|uniref:Acyl-CoA dehydrogenase family protein n=1 Tax=Paenibacillus terricola TaxID=2763503 RepID=A0ABR8MZ91_9BACL|nr:acyl-CoA dehydrogenase family protein [Paenibacillus terricola]MBD3919504.1 acyl-CoA dehydrogenase family protein [Paenibacillus terricola]
MRFELPEELEMLRSVVSDFAQSELASGAVERDANGRFDRSVFNQMAELGLTGIPVPEMYGGAGVGWLTYVVVMEELAKVCASSASVLAAHTAGVVWPLFHYGDEAVREELLVPLASGAKLAGTGVTGRKATSLLGTHSFVLNAGVADGYLLFTEEQWGEGIQKPAVVWTQPDPTVEVTTNLISKLGLRSFPTGELTLVPNAANLKKNIIVQGRRVSGMAREIRTMLALSAAAQSVGIAQGALEAAASYAKTRKQFGTPIGRQQGILFKLSDMSIATEASRLLVRQAAWQLDEHINSAAASKQVKLAHTYAVRTATMVAREAVQIHGGYGYIEEYQVERMLRDAMTLETAVGVGGLSKR